MNFQVPKNTGNLTIRFQEGLCPMKLVILSHTVTNSERKLLQPQKSHSPSLIRTIRKAVSKFYCYRISAGLATSVVLDCKPSHLSSSTTDCADKQEHRRNVLQFVSTELCPHDVPERQSPTLVQKQ